MPAETETGTEQARIAAPATKRFDSKHSFALASIFVSALVLRIWFNFSADHANCAGCCDASEYVRNAAALSSMLTLQQEFWHKFFAAVFGVASPADLESVRASMSGLKEVYQAGPVFPIFLTLSFSVAAFMSTEVNPLGAPVFIQSVLSALACCLIADMADKAWNRRVGYLAGALAAIYPGFIVNSGRLYTESFATFLICVLLSLVVRGFFTANNVIARSLAIGFLSACLQLTRSILVISSLAMVPILFAQQRAARWKAGLVSLLLGFACVVLPWVSFQHVAFDKGGIMVDRVGNYNLFIGSNTQTQGWLTFPYPDGHGIEKLTLTKLLIDSYKESPARFIRLMLDKPARLFQQPWNDFKTNIGIIDVGAQSLFHQFLLLTFGLGVLLALFTDPSKKNPAQGQIYSRLLLLAFAGLHFVYALFITVPRYALTAMPCLIAFSAAGIYALVALFFSAKSRVTAGSMCGFGALLWFALHTNLVQPLMESGVLSNATVALVTQSAIRFVLALVLFLLIWTALKDTSGYRRVARVSAVGLLLMMIPLVILPSRASGRWYEWQKPLALSPSPQIPLTQSSSSQSPSIQSIALEKPMPGKQTYLLVDANGAQSLSGVEVQVNGKKLTGPKIPGMALAQDYAVLRHVNAHKVSWEGENIFNFMTRPADLSNAELRQWFLIPVPKQVTESATALNITMSKAANAAPGFLYGTYKHGKQLSIPSLEVYSWEKAFYGVENENGATDPRLDQSLSLLQSSSASSPNVRLLIPAAEAGRLDGIQIARDVGNDIGSDTVSLLKRVNVPPGELTAQTTTKPFVIYTMPPFTPKDMWIVRTTGSIKSTNGLARPTFTLKALCKSGGDFYDSPWTPNFLSTSQQWQSFDVSTPIAPAQLPGGIKQLQGEFLFDVPKWKTRRALPADAVQLKDVRIDIIRLPGNPLARGYTVR